MSDCEIIEDVLSFVFEYLNEKQLRNAYLVCKSWLKVGKSVFENRGPLCKMLTRKKTEKHMMFLPRIKTLLTRHVKYPSLCIFISNDLERFSKSDGCHCPLLPNDSISIWIDNPSYIFQSYFLSAALFPPTTLIKKKIFTIIYKLQPPGFFCEEVDNREGSRFYKITNLKLHFDYFFENRSSSKICMITWCKQSKFKMFKTVIKQLGEVYPYSEIATWGGTADNLGICNREHRLCRDSVHFFFLFMSGRQMETKTLILDQNSEARKLIARRYRVLSENTVLRSHSIAFMYMSQYRYQRFFKWETTLFKQYFPSVKLFHTVGKEPFQGKGLVDLFKQLHLPQVEGKNVNTTILLLTFN